MFPQQKDATPSRDSTGSPDLSSLTEFPDLPQPGANVRVAVPQPVYQRQVRTSEVNHRDKTEEMTDVKDLHLQTIPETPQLSPIAGVPDMSARATPTNISTVFSSAPSERPVHESIPMEIEETNLPSEVRPSFQNEGRTAASDANPDTSNTATMSAFQPYLQSSLTPARSPNPIVQAPQTDVLSPTSSVPSLTEIPTGTPSPFSNSTNVIQATSTPPESTFASQTQSRPASRQSSTNMFSEMQRIITELNENPDSILPQLSSQWVFQFFQTEILALKNAKTQLKEDLSAMEREHELSQNQAKEAIESTKAELKNEMEQLKQQNLQEIEGKDQMIEILAEQRKTADEEAGVQMATINEYRRKVEESQENAESLRRTIEEQEESMSELRTKMKNTKEQLDGKVKELKKEVRRNQRLQSKMNEWEEKCSQQSGRVEDLEKELEERKKEIEKTKEKVRLRNTWFQKCLARNVKQLKAEDRVNEEKQKKGKDALNRAKRKVREFEKFLSEEDEEMEQEQGVGEQVLMRTMEFDEGGQEHSPVDQMEGEVAEREQEEHEDQLEEEEGNEEEMEQGEDDDEEYVHEVDEMAEDSAPIIGQRVQPKRSQRRNWQEEQFRLFSEEKKKKK